ncbi:MAG: winged helix-turn-helix domain-containing protein [Rhodospirillaceae bacterium]
MPPALKISNREARRLWLAAQGLAANPTGALDLDAVIKRLGFVQLDTIQVVARAHHHILWSRNQSYREPMLDRFMRQDRGVFEHFTHDASVIPMAFYPVWQGQFQRMEAKTRKRGWHQSMAKAGGLEVLIERLRAEGPLCTRDFDTKIAGPKKMWARPPHKMGLDYLWYSGVVSTAFRDGFTKFYDLSERIIPAPLRSASVPRAEQIDWLCHGALQRLGFGSPGDVQRFWDAVESAEVKAWIEAQGARLVPVEVEGADRSWRSAFALADIETRLADTPAPTSRLRILNPFDPLIRDRKRLSHLFGFDYTVEMFLPAAQRRWGYYVYPLLEGDRFVGRLEVKAERKTGLLTVSKLWAEPSVQWTTARQKKLDSELDRMARFVGVETIRWTCSRHPLSGQSPI